MNKNRHLTADTIEKIERCIFTIGKPCEVKIEHGEPIVICIHRTPIKSKEDTKVSQEK